MAAYLTQGRLKQQKAHEAAIAAVGLVCQSRMQELLLFSKPLFTFASKMAQVKGRGALVQLWPSLTSAQV